MSVIEEKRWTRPLNIAERKCNTTLVLVPPGVTSKVQPLDVMINSEFKKSVDRQAREMLAKDPKERRFLFFLKNGQGKLGKKSPVD